MLRRHFSNLALFEGFDQEQIGQLSPFFEEGATCAGELVFEQGDPARYLYILLEGEVEVRYKPYDGPFMTVARITPGGVFGWSAALGRSRYTSGAIAMQDSQVVRVRTENLQRVIACYPQTGGVLLDRLASVIAERLRNTHASILKLLSHGVETNDDYER